MCETLEELWTKIVSTGKKSQGFTILGRIKGRDDAKYRDPNDLEKSGAASIVDCGELYSAVQNLRPRVIVEVGTWFGTTAMIMAKALIESQMDSVIYTCDKHNVYHQMDPYRDYIRYYNMRSHKFFQRIIRAGKRADFIFLDASLKEIDMPYLKNLCHKDTVIYGHDMHQRKGKKNIMLIQKTFKKTTLQTAKTSDIMFVIRLK